MPDSAPIGIARERALMTMLVLAAVIPYVQTLAFGYVLDDTYAIRSNPTLVGWSSLGRVWLEQFGGTAGPFQGLYRPVTMTLFAAVFNAGAKWPLWFHVTAVLLHLAATLLLVKLLRRVMTRGAAMFAALWFAVHPVHVEAVANITNTSEVLVAIWTLLLALYLLPRIDSPLDWQRAVVAGAIYLAAMFSKESGAMAAPVALLLAWLQSEDRLTTRWFVQRWRLVAAFGAAVLIVAVARAVVLGGPVTGKPIGALGVEGLSFGERALTAASVVPRIATLLIWPTGVDPHYGPSAIPDNRVAMAALGLLVVGIAVAIGAWWMRRGDRRVLAAVAVTMLAFLPASNLLVATGQVLAERTLYLPSVGVVVAAGVLLERLAQYSSQRANAHAIARVGLVAVATLLLLAGVNTTQWVGHWRNHETVFARMIEADPNDYAGYLYSGQEAARQQRPEVAVTMLAKAYALEPRDRGVVLAYGDILTRGGQVDSARRIYSDALKHATKDSIFSERLRALGAR